MFYKVMIPGHPEYEYTKTYHTDPTCSTWKREGEFDRESVPATPEDIHIGRLCTRQQCQRIAQ